MPPLLQTKKTPSAQSVQASPPPAASKASAKKRKSTTSSARSDGGTPPTKKATRGDDDEDEEEEGEEEEEEEKPKAKVFGGYGGMNQYEKRQPTIAAITAAITKAQENGDFESADWEDIFANTQKTNQEMELELERATTSKATLVTRLSQLQSIQEIPTINFPSQRYHALRKEYEKEENNLQSILNTPFLRNPDISPLTVDNSADKTLILMQRNRIAELEAEIAQNKKNAEDAHTMRRKLMEIALTGKMDPLDKIKYADEASIELGVDEVLDILKESTDTAWAEAEQELRGLSLRSNAHWTRVEARIAKLTKKTQ